MAFVIGADERHISYAVKSKFKDIEGIQIDIGKEYLEKLIQYPIRIPQLNADEVEMYIACLLLQSELNKDDFSKVLSWVISKKREDFEKFRMNSVGDLFNDNHDLQAGVIESLSIANQLASVLSNGLHGNPRQCKRFLNSLYMRLQMAKYKNKVLDRKILAKIMMLEYIKPRIFNKIAELAANNTLGDELKLFENATTEKDLFAKVRKGQVRVLIGSTAKMGAGTNVQDKLKALHDLDCPWRPADLEQRHGRIIRQGNENKDLGGVDIFRYVTEATFDAYLYQTIENKQRFISQIMSSKSPVRSCEDVDEATLSYAEVKALCAGNPLIKEKMDLDISVSKLKVLKANHVNQQYHLEDNVRKIFPERIAKTEQRISGYKSDLAFLKAQPIVVEGIAPMTVMDKAYTEKEAAGAAILQACKQVKQKSTVDIGNYKGFDMSLSYDSFANEFHLDLQRDMTYTVTLGTSEIGNIARIDNALDSISKQLENSEVQLETLNSQLESAKSELGKPFPHEDELNEKLIRLAELNSALDIDGTETENSELAVADKKPDISADKKSSIHDRLNAIKERQENDKKPKSPTPSKENEI